MAVKYVVATVKVKQRIYADCWHIPGGGINDGEDKLTALKREMAEEVRLDVSDSIITLADEQCRGETKKVLKIKRKILCKIIFNVHKIDIDIEAQEIKAIPNDDLMKLAWISISDH
jgi:8-oxo-dGTP pyrophosphatase MutT (NUDIX family)